MTSVGAVRPALVAPLLILFCLGPVGSWLDVGSAFTEIVMTFTIPEFVPITVTVVVPAVFIDWATRFTLVAVVVVELGEPENFTILVL